MTVTIDPTQVASAVSKNAMVGTGTDDCPFCTRIGLPILPVRYAVFDRLVSNWTQEMPWPMAVYASRNLPVLEGARYGLRLMREGYLYLYDEKRQRWQSWMITSDSRLCEFPPGGRPPKAEEDAHVEVPCNVEANNLSSLLISIPDAKQAGVVHVAYSDHLWTESTLDGMASNEEGVRDKVMQPFDVADWLSQSSAVSTMQPEYLSEYLPEFSNRDLEPLLDNDCFEYPSPSAQSLLDEEQLIERMNWVVRNEPDLFDKGAVLAIKDPIGITISLNHFRNNAKIKIDRYVSRDDIVENKVTSEIILGIKNALQSRADERAQSHVERIENMPLFGNEGAADHFDSLPDDQQADLWSRMSERDRERITEGRKQLEKVRESQAQNAPVYRGRAIEMSWEKYQERYSEQQRSTFESQYYARLDTEHQVLTRLASDHVEWLLSEAVADAMRSYDSQNRGDGVAYEVAVAAMTTGMTFCSEGMDAMEQLVDRPIEDIDSIVWRALYGNHQPAIDIAKDYALGTADWGRKVISPLRRLLAAEAGVRSRFENLVAETSGVLAKKLGLVSVTDIANNSLARMWQALSWARYGKHLSLLKYHASAGSLSALYDQVLWRDEHSVHAMRGNSHYMAPFIEQSPGGQGEQRLWALIPTELDPHERAVIEAHLVDSIEWRRLSIQSAMTPGNWFGVFALGLEVINTNKAMNALGDEHAAASQFERNSNFIAASLGLVSSFTGVANSIAVGVVGEGLKERAIYRGVAWTSGITGAIASWIFSGWMAYKFYRSLDENERAIAVAYGTTALTLFGAGGASLAATAQNLGFLRPGASVGGFVISRAGWGLVASWLGWAGLAMAILTIVIEKDQLEKWLECCVFGNKGDDDKFGNLREALDRLREISN